MKPWLLTVLLLVASCVVAEDPAPAGSVKVDIDRVVAERAVRPANGISSAGQPSAEALAVFSDSGYAAVIDLRGESENRGFDEPAVVRELGMNYVPFPITDRDAINFDAARALEKLIKEQDGPVLLHCGSGNRVGAMLALIESLNGADAEQALAAGKEGGLTSLEPVVRERLK